MTELTMLNPRSEREAFLNARVRELEAGWEIKLPDASETKQSREGKDFIARVRKLELGEKAAYIGVSEETAQYVYQSTRDYQESIKGRTESGGIGEFDVLDMINEPEFEDVVNTVCIAAFIDPPLVATESELSANPNAWLVTDFTFGDRIHVFNALQRPGSKEAGLLTRFRPESELDVEDTKSQQDAATAKRSNGPTGRRLDA